MSWSHQFARDRYVQLCYTGMQTTEKHIRHTAERIVNDLEGGWKTPPAPTYQIPWMAPDGYRCIDIVVPPGCHGYALQLVIEEQMRDVLGYDHD